MFLLKYRFLCAIIIIGGYMKKRKLFIYGIDGMQSNYAKAWADSGKLPNLKRLMERGVFFSDCYSVFPTISPTCWNSIFTGAVPKVHGIVDDVIIDKYTHPVEQLSGYCGDLVKAERFWDTIAKQGKKTLLLDVLASGPRKSDGVTQVIGHQTVTANNDYVSGIPCQYYTLKKDGYRSATTKGDGVIVFDENCSKLSENTYKVKVVKGEKPFTKDEIEDFSWVIIMTRDGIKIGDSESSAKQCPVIKKGCWSDVLTRNLSTLNTIAPFHFRAYLEEKGADYVVVYLTESRNLVKEILPESDRLWIEQIPEIHKTADGDFYRNVDKFYDTAYFVRDWKRRVIKKALKRDSYDVIFDYEILIDTTNHYELGVYEGVGTSSVITPDRAKKDVEKAYKFVDEQIGWLLDNVIDDDTTFCVVSDHGGVGPKEEFRFFEALSKAGLITYTTEDKATHTHKNLNVDWSKTKAYPAGCCHINVNLKGREPTGIVEKEEFDKVVQEIIGALQKYTVLDDGTRGIAFAVSGEQAGFVGLGGGYTGDVVYGITGSGLGGYFGGVHAEQIPSGKSKTGGDMRPVCVTAGRDFKSGVVVDRPTDLTDIVPTLCYAMDYPQPRDATGGVVFQALKEDR